MRAAPISSSRPRRTRRSDRACGSAAGAPEPGRESAMARARRLSRSRGDVHARGAARPPGCAAPARPCRCATIYDAVMAVHDGAVERALVPIENSLEGSVSATLDVLAIETRGCPDHRGDRPADPAVPDRAARSSSCDEIETVVSHPQANGQCARFIRTRLTGSRGDLGVVDGGRGEDRRRARRRPWAALGNRVAAELYGCEVLRAGVRGRPGQRDPFRLARTPQTRRRGSRDGRDAARARGRRRSCSGASARRPRLAGRVPLGVRLPRRQPDADRVASAQAGPRAIHVLRRPRGPRRRGERRSRRSTACVATSRCCGCSGSFPAARRDGGMSRTSAANPCTCAVRWTPRYQRHRGPRRL